MKRLFCGLLLISMMSAQASAHQPLSFDEAVTIIWKMKYKDISELYGMVFPGSQKNKNNDVGHIEYTATKMEKIGTFIKQHIWGPTPVDSVLQLFLSVGYTEQEALKKEIKASYNEYQGTSMLGLMGALLIFPIGFPMLVAYQIGYEKAIEARRARSA